MRAYEEKPERLRGHAQRFPTTHWSMVISAGGHRGGAGVGGDPEAGRALATLCEKYWFPLYSFVRRAGYSAEDAQDLTQEFFAGLLARRSLASVDREKGRFRSFLLAAMKHFLADQRDRAHAQKRGGGHTVISFDSLDAEARYGLEPASNLTPERVFERQWALALLAQVLSRLEAELVAEGKSALFQALKATLSGARSSGYATIGAELGMSEGAVKVAAHRLRRRYRALLREEIGQTLADTEEIGEEIRYLMGCL